MKRTYFLLLILIVITQVYAQNESAETRKTYRCGDNVISPGEDCANCPADVKCLGDELCVSGRCQKVEKTNTNLVLGIAIGILVIAALIALFLYYKRRKELGLINIEKKLAEEQKAKEEIKIEEQKEPELYKEVEEVPKLRSVSSVLLKNFIMDRLEDGETRQSITNKLEKAGWKREKIDLAFAALAKEHKEKATKGFLLPEARKL